MEDKLDQFVRESLLKSVELSENLFDKNLNIISSGALILSVTFLNKVIPVYSSLFKWILVAGWGALVCSLIINLWAHWLASRNAMKTLHDHDMKDPNLFEKTQRRNRRMNNITTAAGFSMVAGLLSLVIYCSINIYNMPDPTRLPNPEPERKGMPSYVPSTQPTPSPQVQPAPTSNPAPSNPELPRKP